MKYNNRDLKSIHHFVYVLLSTVITGSVAAQQTEVSLKDSFDLAGNPFKQTQYFRMQSELIKYAANGKREGKDILILHLKAEPAGLSGHEYGQFTCMEFHLNRGDSSKVTVPGLKNWTYSPDPENDEMIFGIGHQRFEKLVDDSGRQIEAGLRYHIYNTFIDFHSFCQVFAMPTSNGKGIQDLTRIGQSIVHNAAYTQPPTNLGATISEGSYFRNGRIMLVFKGLTLVKNRPCALIGFDSGNSSFKMIMQPSANMKVITSGSSHYQGDIYKDLKSMHVQRVRFTELTVSQSTIPMPPHEISAVVERHILIENISKELLIRQKQ